MPCRQHDILLSLLEDEQVKRNWSNAEMARQLGCTRALWSMTRKGLAPIGWSVCCGTMRRFPHLRDEVVFFMASSVEITTVCVGNQT